MSPSRWRYFSPNVHGVKYFSNFRRIRKIIIWICFLLKALKIKLFGLVHAWIITMNELNLFEALFCLIRMLLVLFDIDRKLSLFHFWIFNDRNSFVLNEQSLMNFKRRQRKSLPFSLLFSNFFLLIFFNKVLKLIK